MECVHMPAYQPDFKTLTSFSVPSKFPDLLEATAEELITGLEAGDFTSVDLVTVYRLRIEEVNPLLNVVTELNPDVRVVATARRTPLSENY